MRLISLLVLCVATARVAVAIAPSNTPDGEQLCFTTQSQGLAWPITSGTDVGQLIPHGPHCVDMIEQYAAKPPTNEVDVFHLGHCARLAARMRDFFVNNKGKKDERYTLPRIVCDDFRGLYGMDRPDMSIYRKTTTIMHTLAIWTREPVRLPNLGRCMTISRPWS